MSKISEEGYLFIHSGILEKSQIETCFFSAIKFLSETYDEDLINCQFEINVVTNKENKKYGHTYAWVSDKRVYYALIGKNFDGSERIEYVPDENWKEPEIDYSEAFSESNGNWAEESEIDSLYERPNIGIKLEPLVSLPAIKYTQEQEKEIEYKSKYGFLEVFEVKLTKKSEKLNNIFSNNIPHWVDEKLIYDYFKKYNKDPIIYQDKKSKKNFNYPIVKIKNKKDNKRYCIIYFSPLNKNTASFLINITKRVTITKGENSEILFFSQSREK